jgi:hypothetical protein
MEAGEIGSRFYNARRVTAKPVPLGTGFSRLEVGVMTLAVSVALQ